ncbi:DUF3307 domain-containing protein [Sutcliffiella horikoshii]|uniref:DUF3307 domain-containing protein n=1 Tax=Sutcliffiella horikoshii TaxID=79883 RepID=A0A5D4T822_9BACI|nr:DUF3307 domain-containing protein [Sutcliffiella horikoshii]TYS70376.1 DUF3307 domain-containing protein [Sutcliffiella horikoshii]
MIILTLILAHLIADFYFQTEHMVKEKRKFLKLHLFHHAAIKFIFLLSIYFYQGNDFLVEVLMPTILLVGIHGGIDYLKIIFQEKTDNLVHKNAWNLGLFIVDQLLHVITILAVCYFTLQVDLKNTFHTILLLINLKEGLRPEIGILEGLLFLLVMLVLCTTVTGHLIRIMLGSLTKHISLFEGKYTLKDLAISPNSEKNMSEEYTYIVMKHQDLSRGKVIGYLERLLVVALILMGSFSAVGFIVAAKSLTRFKQMDDRDWAEYFLLGTLTSFLFAIIYGVLLKIVFFGSY